MTYFFTRNVPIIDRAKPAFVLNEEKKKRREREEKRVEAAERVLLELAKVRATEEAEVSRQLSELKDRPDRNWNTEVKETLKKAGSIPQSLQK